MFEELLDEIEKEKDDKSNSPVNINLSQNMFIISDLFKQKMKELNSIPENELIELVKYSYQSILDHISTTTDPNYINSFTNTRFLKVLIQVLSSEKSISESNIRCCNRLAYDYFTLSATNPTIKELLFGLSKVVNRAKILQLLGIGGITEELAAYLALSANSDSNGITNVKRVNFILLQQPVSKMTTQYIVKIYEKLFDSAKEIFIGTITDAYKEATLDGMAQGDSDKFKSIETIYNREVDAAIAILNSLPFENIKFVIRELNGLILFNSYTIDNFRCSLRSMAETPDNFRVRTAIEQVESFERKYLF